MLTFVNFCSFLYIYIHTYIHLGQKLSSPGDNNGSTNSNTVNNTNNNSRSNSSSNAVDTDFVQVHTLEEGDVIVGSTVDVEEEEEDSLK